MNQTLAEYLQAKKELIEQALERLIPERNVPYGFLFEAAHYSLLGGGKRLRPILALATAEAFGADLENALIPACTLELVHTYSLIHDDLPCMDNDDFRRGKPTLHKVVSEGQAVLAGDFLLTYAFETLAHAHGISNSKKIQLISLLSKSAGGEGMVAGQAMDLRAENHSDINLEELTLIHVKKTGALLSASVEFGGILADATEHQLATLRAFGLEIGLAFQIIDDVLDVTASQSKHGKAVASDVINKKSTYVTLLGLERAQEQAQQLLMSAKKKLSQLPIEGEILLSLVDWIVKRTS